MKNKLFVIFSILLMTLLIFGCAGKTTEPADKDSDDESSMDDLDKEADEAGEDLGLDDLDNLDDELSELDSLDF